MENRLVLFMLLVVIPFWVAARNSNPPAVCSNDITLATQAEVDAFEATYSCTELSGMLTISGDDITNLHGLSAITSVGTLYISNNNALINMDGLSNLTTVGNSCSCALPGLIIADNPALTNLQGLLSLSRVEGNLKLTGNIQLVDLAGLESITFIGGMLDIYSNAQLTSIGALSAVTTVGIWNLSSQSVRISRNSSLTRIGILQGITSLPGELMIQDNTALVAVDGFSSLTQINGRRANMFITGNTILTNINGFGKLTAISGGGAGAVLTISNNAALKNMSGFSSLANIGGGVNVGLIISNNATLTEVDGLSKLLSINGGNFSLTVTNNPMLNRGCGLYPLLDMNGVGGGFCESSTCPAITISGNGPNCTREIILSGGPCPPVVACPVDKVMIAENASACGSLSTKIIIQSPEANVMYTLRDNQNNSVVAGPLNGTNGLPTGLITKTTVYNVLATNSNTGCEVVMSSLPLVTVNPIPLDKMVVAESDSILSGTGSNIIVREGEPNVVYTLRRDKDNSIVEGPKLSPSILPTGSIFETTTFNVLASSENCEKVLDTRVTVTVVVPIVVTGIINNIASMSLYPNPCNGEFQIRFLSNQTGQYHLSLYDFAGSLVQEKSIEGIDEFHTAQMDLKPLPAGIYFVSIIGAGGINTRKRLVITNQN